MKAEHRKELETNLLADRMGRMVQRVKGGPQKKTVLLAVCALVVVVAILLVLRSRSENKAENSLLWMYVEDGAGPYVQKIISEPEYAQTTQCKVVKFHLAKLRLWDEGLKLMGHSSAEAFKRIDIAAKIYESLAEECKDDPVFEPEALFALAVIEETQTLRSQDKLDSAKAKYKELADKYPDSAYGKLAKKQAENLEAHRPDVLNLYQELQISFNVTDDRPRPKFAPQQPDPTPPPLPPPVK